MRKLTTLLLVLTLGVATAACGDDSDSADSTDTTAADGGDAGDQSTTAADTSATTMIGSTSAEVQGTADVTDAIDVEVGDNFFKPNVLTAKGGSTITLNLNVDGSNPHNISVEGQDVDQALANGDTFAAKVTVPATGQVVFFCKIHRGGGMVGAVNAT